MKHIIYILFSEEIDRYYVGVSSDVESRLKKHLSNYKGYTSKAKDWVVVYTEDYKEKKDVLTREKEIKKWKSRKMIEKLIQN